MNVFSSEQQTIYWDVHYTIRQIVKYYIHLSRYASLSGFVQFIIFTAYKLVKI